MKRPNLLLLFAAMLLMTLLYAVSDKRVAARGNYFPEMYQR